MGVFGPPFSLNGSAPVLGRALINIEIEKAAWLGYSNRERSFLLPGTQFYFYSPFKIIIMKKRKITKEEGIALLKKGNTLTEPGINLDTLRTKDDKYIWMGLTDKAPTILDEVEVESLISQKRWIVNLLI